MHDMNEEQLSIEQESVKAGIERYRKTLAEQGEVSLTPGQTLLKKAIQPLALAITAFCEEVKGGRPVRGASVVVKFLDQFDADVAAYITARYSINAIPRRMSLQALALVIAGALEDALNHDELKKQSPGLYRQLQRKIEKSGDERYRHVVLRKQMKFAKVETIEWTQKHKLQLGELLVHLMAQHTGLITCDKVWVGDGKSPILVMPTPETLEWLEKSHARCELLSPVYLPMVVKPRPWSGPFGGGYLSKTLRFPLVKTANRNYLEELRSWQMPKVYLAVNALQDTAWQINSAVLKVLREVWDGGGNLGKLPPRDLLPLPAKTFAEDAGKDDERVKTWRKDAAKVYEANARLVSKRVAMIFKLEIAERFAKYPNLHFVHALDWRGRAYAVGSYVHPQSDDSGKALLQFAAGHPLGDNGAYWLAVHGANLFGVDKVSFDDRVKWVQDNEERIIECAANPLDGSRMWADADKPYQFLAFCFEWAGLSVWHNAGKQVSDYVSHLPVAMDGSCNGLQNFACLLRDEVGGAAVNLIPSDKPSDVYTEVCNVASEIIERDACGEGDKAVLAAKWIGKLNRKLVKRNTMTVPYAVTEFGMRDQMMKEFKKLAGDGELPVDEYSFADAMYIASVNYEAIGNVVVAARSAMTWLQDTAKIAAQDGLPIKWVAPSGMLVVQDYRKVKGQVFDSRISGKRVQLTLYVESTELDRRRMAAGIAPNFIHAADASHMVATVNRCLGSGLSDFAMIHDSFGTHAGNIDTLAHELRAAFVDQYTPDVLGGFRQQVVEQLPEELAKQIPDVPPFGKLEVAGVLNSDYFFA